MRIKKLDNQVVSEYDFLGDMDLKYNKVFSAVDIEEAKFETWKNVIPFYQNVLKEGITLWKAA